MGCHSQRYVRALIESGDRLMDIGRMKQREAETLLEQAQNLDSSDAAAKELGVLRLKMEKHLHNVSLGVGHQSPDYQWWHGQPALDGDLIRIKANYTRLRREQDLE